MIIWTHYKGFLYVIVDGDVWKTDKNTCTIYIRNLLDIERTTENTLRIHWGF